jgi:hypothetical protein
MTNPITAYDDGLTHGAFAYQSDTGNLFAASIRFCYPDDVVIAGGFLPPGTRINKPKALKMRHLIFTSMDASRGRRLKRTVPCNLVDVAHYFPPGSSTPIFAVFDGENFVCTGFHGETWRSSGAPT